MTPQADKNIIDAVRGMLLLGAYGDALGAPHEHDGLAGRITDPEDLGRLARASTFYPPDTPGQPWWVWADANAVQTMRGLLTDDTSFRMMLLHPWLAQTAGRRALMTESAFFEWLHREKEQTTTIAYPPGLWRSRQQQITAWLRIYEAAENGQSESFFAPDVPVVFGLFMYLDLAVLYGDDDPVKVYTLFRNCSLLDQGSAGVFTGLLAGILAAGVRTQTSPAQFTDGFIDTAWQLIKEAASEATDRELQDLHTAKEVLENMVHFGKVHRPNSGHTFLKTFRAQIYTDTALPFHTSPSHLKNYHPLLFWVQIISTLAYTADRPFEALRILSAGVGDTDTVASILGSIMGTWMGYDQVYEGCIGDTPLKKECDAISQNSRTLYCTDLEDRVDLFVQKAHTV